MKYIEGMKGQDEGGSTEEGLELMWMALLSLSTIRSDSPVAATTTPLRVIGANNSVV